MGLVGDYPFLFGLLLDFSLDGGGSGIGDGGKYCLNMSPNCKWETRERKDAITCMVESIFNLLNDAKVSNVESLKGIPVEVTIEGGCFKDFRILKEVL